MGRDGTSETRELGLKVGQLRLHFVNLWVNSLTRSRLSCWLDSTRLSSSCSSSASADASSATSCFASALLISCSTFGGRLSSGSSAKRAARATTPSGRGIGSGAALSSPVTATVAPATRSKAPAGTAHRLCPRNPTPLMLRRARSSPVTPSAAAATIAWVRSAAHSS